MAKILVIDDEELMRQLVETVLAGQGHEVITAADGEAGVAAAKDAMPELIITDMNMPGMTGWEVMRTLKADDTTKHIKIIALTAKHTAESVVDNTVDGVKKIGSKIKGMAQSMLE